MIDVYNALLELAHERLNDLTAAPASAPARMPRREDVQAAMDSMMADRYAIPNPLADPVLKSCLLRIWEINNLVQADAESLRRRSKASLVTAGGAAMMDEEDLSFTPWPRTVSGEIACPECSRGTLCYLIGREGGAFVECSTVDCLYWDSRR